MPPRVFQEFQISLMQAVNINMRALGSIHGAARGIAIAKNGTKPHHLRCIDKMRIRRDVGFAQKIFKRPI